jgi:hypothetical protein
MMDYRNEIWGMDGPAIWKALLPASGLEGLEIKGNWSRDWDTVTCEAGNEGAHLLFGANDWRDYELKVTVVPEAGGNVQIPFRLSEDGQKGYMLDLLLGWQAVAISRLGRGVEKLSVVNYQLRHGREYHIELAVRGFSLTSYINGSLVNQVTVFDYEKGRFALNVWNARTRFRNPMYRRLG